MSGKPGPQATLKSTVPKCFKLEQFRLSNMCKYPMFSAENEVKNVKKQQFLFLFLAKKRHFELKMGSKTVKIDCNIVDFRGF